jgi:uncharacterized protein (DUF169 family)
MLGAGTRSPVSEFNSTFRRNRNELSIKQSSFKSGGYVTTLNELNSYGEDLERLLLLRTSPIAVKLLKKEEDIPEGAIRPKRDRGVHLAQCQAFAMSRRQGATIAMLKEDNWCWGPLIAFGLVEPPEFFLDGKIFFPHMVASQEASKNLAKTFPRLEYGKYAGIVSAPLKKTNFEPDLVMIYSNSAQLRSLLLAIKYKEGYQVTSTFDPIDSCVYSVVPVLLTGQCRITLPDPGDYERALAKEDEIIFSVPRDKLEELILGLRHFEEIHLGYTHFVQEMRPDFPQPEFYKTLFRMWGLDVEEC